jgi:hypothetical protein
MIVGRLGEPGNEKTAAMFLVNAAAAEEIRAKIRRKFSWRFP